MLAGRVPWRDGDLTGAGPSDQVETSPEPFRQPGNAGLPAMRFHCLHSKDILSEPL